MCNTQYYLVVISAIIVTIIHDIQLYVFFYPSYNVVIVQSRKCHVKFPNFLNHHL